MVDVESVDVFESGGVFSGIYVLEGTGSLNGESIKQEERKIIGYDSTELFKLAMVNIQSEEVFESGGVFSGIYILEGNGYLNDEIIKPGEQFFISAMCEKFEIKGNLRFIRFWGPRGRN